MGHISLLGIWAFFGVSFLVYLNLAAFEKHLLVDTEISRGGFKCLFSAKYYVDFRETPVKFPRALPGLPGDEFVTPCMAMRFCKFHLTSYCGQGNPLLSPELLSANDTLCVENDYFDNFKYVYLPRLKVPIYLFTFQEHLPALSDSSIIDNPLIIKWFCQNAFHPKQIPLPFGLDKRKLPEYQKVYNSPILKSTIIKLLPLSKTHTSREPLVDCKENRLNVSQYYQELSSSLYTISPRGDRPDCYRHWEAIGLGTIPICNCYGYQIRSMEVSEMLAINQRELEKSYEEPVREMVLVKYWESFIMRF